MNYYAPILSTQCMWKLKTVHCFFFFSFFLVFLIFCLCFVTIIGLGPDEELPDYDLDSEDEEWLSVQSRERVRPL